MFASYSPHRSVYQIKGRGWGDASLSLCARMVAEVRSLCQHHFHGVELESPKAMCCARGCNHALGALQNLATSALRTDDVHAVITCADGHSTCLQRFVGMLPDAEDADAAELLYWLRIVQHRVGSESSTGADDKPYDDDSDGDDGGDGDDVAAPLCAQVYTSLANALLRWSAQVFHEAGAPSSCCPRVWVPMRVGHTALALRPVCEHPDCLHAVRTHSRRAMDDVASLVEADTVCQHSDTHGSHTPIVPLRALTERSGLVLAALTQAAAYGDEDDQTCHASSVSASVEALLTALPADAQVSVSRLSALHKTLRKPLRWVHVGTHDSKPTDSGNSLSKLWLCKHHAFSTMLRRREQAMKDAVARLARWFWHDGHASHAYSDACNSQLESAFRCGEARAKLHVSSADGVGVSAGTVHTVLLRASPMSVTETGATVVRISTEVCVLCAVEVWRFVLCMCMFAAVHIYLCRHPLPSTWTTNCNRSIEELHRSDREFAEVEQQLLETLPRATLIRVSR